MKEDFGFAANGLRFSHNYHSEGEDPGVGEAVCLVTSFVATMKPFCQSIVKEEGVELARLQI